MKKEPFVDNEILSILNDYHLFIDGEKYVDMPYLVNTVDKNHPSSLEGEAKLSAEYPLGSTILSCEVRDKNEYKYSFKILSDLIDSRMLFRMDEGNKAHWNRHLPVPVDQQQVPTPHFHKVGDDGIMYAYSTDDLKSFPTPLNIHDGFVAFCNECHINQEDIRIDVHEAGTLPLEYEQEPDSFLRVDYP